MERLVPGTKEMEQQQQQGEETVKADRGDGNYEGRHPQPPHISEMKPVTREAYGGGMYAADDEPAAAAKDRMKPRASETQSADGPEDRTPEPKHKPPPSTGDRDLDITGQSYIQ